MKRIRTLLLICFTFVYISAGTASAQDAHYWTNQFGNQARLLGGAVIGSAADLSAVYYNPGALALVENPELLLAGNVFEITNVKVQGSITDEQGDSYWSARLSPSLFAGEIGSTPGGNRFAYSFLTRDSAKLRINDRASASGVDFAVPGLEFISADYRFDTELNEYWFGGTWSRPINERTGVGVSTFFAYRGHRARVQSTVQALAEDGRAAVAIQARDFDYWQLRLLWKVGLSTRLNRWRVGVTVTTPSIGLFGQGETSYDHTFVGQTVDENGNPLTDIATNTQTPSPEYHSPFSIGGGAARLWGDTRLHFSAEWFTKAEEFTVLDAEPFEAQSSGEIIETALYHALDSVFNVAVGVEHTFSEGLQAYGGFRTDFSGLGRESGNNGSVSYLNIYHLSGGAVFKAGGQDITLGGVLAFGSAPIARDNILHEIGKGSAAEWRYLRFTFVVGINLVF
jgi:hypothetical protein